MAVAEQDCGNHHGPGTIIEGLGHSLRQGRGRQRRHPGDGQSLFFEPVELPPHRMEFAVGGNDAGTLPQRQGRHEANQQFVSVLPQCHGAVLGVVSQQAPESRADQFGLLECPTPLLIDVVGRILPGTLIAVQAPIGPRLVRVPSEQTPLADAEPTVVWRQSVRLLVERLWLHDRSYNSVRMAHKSGNASWNRVDFRYSAPLDPPVPRLVPIVRWTIFTCR